MTDTCRYPEPTVGALILNGKGQILLVKSEKWKTGLSLPGGHIELGETAEQALIREVKEEVGLEVSIVRFIHYQNAVFSEEFWKPKHFVFLDFLCQARYDSVKVDQTEIQDFIWVEARKALGMPLESFTRKTLVRYLKETS